MSWNQLLESLNSTSSLTLQCIINKFLQLHLKCPTVFITYLLDEANEGLIQVIGESVLEQEYRFNIHEEPYLRSDALMEKENYSIDQDIKEILKIIFSSYPKNLLAVPVEHPERRGYNSFIVYLVNLDYNGTDNEYNYFMFIKECFDSCSALLLNAFKLNEEKRRRKLNRKLMVVAQNLLLNISDYNDILMEIAMEARLLIDAERCSLFLLSEDGSELVGNVFDGVPEEDMREIRIPIRYGIVGLVATNGEIVNVHNAQNQSLFYKNSNETSNFKTRNILCFPIRDQINEIIGVVELCNKKSGFCFDLLDVEAAKSLSIYCSNFLIRNILYRKYKLLKADNRLSVEILSYHMRSNEDDYKTLLTCKEKHRYRDMLHFMWQPRQIDNSETFCYTFKMFENLSLRKTWKISKHTLASFILRVRKGYRDLPYHNWSHAFSVAHFSYYLMIHLDLIKKCLITELEGVAFLVATLCHDLDHRGTTNSFQIIAKNCLADLYRSNGSIMERHHFSQTLAILNTDDCNIFENLSVSQYKNVLVLIRDMIIATDVVEHFKILPDERTMSIMGYNPAKKEHRHLLLSLMMTCCDLNDQVKGWLCSRDVAELIYAEFFKQGDMEKEMGKVPAEMMNREKAFIPKLQFEFLTEMCIPCYTVLINIFPSLKEYLRVLEHTASCWKRAMQWFQESNLPEHFSLELIRDLNLQKYVLEE